MAGTPLKNLRMFEAICGKNAFQHIIFVTTMWDEVDEEMGIAREKGLKSAYWLSMLERGAKINRFMRTRESALHVIEPLIGAANAKSSLLLQRELVDMRTQLSATTAGISLISEMETLVKWRQEVFDQIRNAIKDSEQDETTLEKLQDEYQPLTVQWEKTIDEMRKLKLPLGERLTRMTRGKRLPVKFKLVYWS